MGIILPFPVLAPGSVADATQVTANFAALAGAIGQRAVRIIIVGGIYVALSTDQFISVQANAAATVQLPSPATVTGQVVTVKDGLGVAPAYPILITSTTGLIDGAAGINLTTPYASLTLVSDGTQWSII